MTDTTFPPAEKSAAKAPLRAPFSADVGNSYLIGPYGPVLEEVTAFDLPVTGEIPASLVGRFVRNGPNPIEVSDPANHHWFLGEGMVHGVYLRSGKAEWYRNRFVRSRLVCDRLGAPYPLDGAFAAHPHLDPLTGEWHAVTYDLGVKSEIRHVVIGTDGQVNRSVAIPVSDGPMVHDFAMTQRYILIFDLPVVWNDAAAAKGRLFPYQWSETHPARVGLLPRKGAAEDVIWIDVPPCYVFHTANAYDAADGTVVVDLVEHTSVFNTSLNGPGEGPPVLSRWVLNPTKSSISKTVLSRRPQEFPRIDERLTGQKHRYIYGAGIQTDRGSAMCLDTETGTELAHGSGDHRRPGLRGSAKGGRQAARSRAVRVPWKLDRRLGSPSRHLLGAHLSLPTGGAQAERWILRGLAPLPVEVERDGALEALDRGVPVLRPLTAQSPARSTNRKNRIYLNRTQIMSEVPTGRRGGSGRARP